MVEKIPLPSRCGSQTLVRGRSDPVESHSRLSENQSVKRDANMTQLIGELGSKLEKLEELGAFVAAAHLQAAIDALRGQHKSEQIRSKPD